MGDRLLGMKSDEEISVEWWWARVEGKRAVASRLVADRKYCREAWMACGTAVEFGMKAAIMKRARFNTWPDKATRPDLHTHDLRALLKALGVDPKHLNRGLKIKLKTAMDWDRSHDYAISSMERRVARAMYDACFGADGVVEWLKSL